MGNMFKVCLPFVTFLAMGCSNGPQDSGAAMLQDTDIAKKGATVRSVDAAQRPAPLPAEAPPAMATDARGNSIAMEADTMPPSAARSSEPAASTASDRPQPIPAEKRVTSGGR